ncbi:hypothetical protein [Achromobacter insuavis]|uniref:hypothetical protein n=1 Tax=Achromobacter insuavis TaxID=1287735 RepID=UPI000E2FFA8D|nr:hypothetical protein [Achromobacter insuavis]
MTNQNNAAQAANENPLSDEYVNAIIQRHGYDSPESVIAQLHQWIGLHGGEDTVTLLMYEAHKVLSKLRAPVPKPWEELAATVYQACGGYDMPARVLDLLSAAASGQDFAHLINGVLPCCAPVADERAACPTDVCQAGKTDGVLCANEECDRTNGVRPPMCRIPGVREDVLRRAALVSAPVAGEAPTDDEIIDMAVEPLGIDCDRMPYGVVIFARSLLSRYAAPQASAEALEIARAALMEIADLADVEADQRGVIVNQALTKIARMTAAPQADKDGGQQRAGDVDLYELAIKCGAVLSTEDLSWAFSYSAMRDFCIRAHVALSATQLEQGERDEG